jgi:hypothetical protein
MGRYSISTANRTFPATDVEDADIEVLSVESVKADDIISFGTVDAGNEIIVVGNATINATVFLHAS